MGRIIVPSDEDVPRKADLVIIGGGILGAATAFYATRAGLSTLVVEMRDGLATLTTIASEECFRAQFTEPENVAMMLASIEVFEHFAEHIGVHGYDISLHQRGYLFLTDRPDGLVTMRHTVQRMAEAGLRDVELWPYAEAARRFPWISEDVTAATWRARDGWLSAHELTYGFAKGSSATFLLRTEATGIQLDPAGVSGVETSRGPIETRNVVIAAGPFSGVVAALAGVHLPLTILRRQKAIIGHDPLIPQDAPMTIDVTTGAYWRPEVGGAALGWAIDEDPSMPSESVPVDWKFAAIVLNQVRRMAPFWETVIGRLTRDNVFLSAGQYTITPDSKPILGPHSQIAGLHFNLGYSGHGVMGAPEGSRLVIEMVLGRQDVADSPFRFTRFGSGAPAAAEKLVI
jgi:sarcosine oxidase, subunit beta